MRQYKIVKIIGMSSTYYEVKKTGLIGFYFTVAKVSENAIKDVIENLLNSGHIVNGMIKNKHSNN